MSRISPNYYEVLAIPPQSSQEAIRAAYKALCLKLHPDKNPDNEEATIRFQDLTEAYSILGDPSKRLQYDNYYFYEDSDEVHFDCPMMGRAQMDSFFAEMFERYYSRHPDLYDDWDDEDDEDFYIPRRRGRKAADWSQFPQFPTAREIARESLPDKPPKPKASLTSSGIRIEWGKKTPRKVVDAYILERWAPGSEEWKAIYVGSNQFFLDSVSSSGEMKYRLQACNAAGRSEWSDASSIVTSGKKNTKVAQENKPPSIPVANTNKTSKKKKKKNSTQKWREELELAIRVKDKAKLQSLVTKIHNLDESAVNELTEMLQKAQNAIGEITRVEFQESLLSQVEQALNMGQLEPLTKALNSAIEYISSLKEKKERIHLHTRLQSAKEKQQTLLQVHKDKEDFIQEVEKAKDERDVDQLHALVGVAQERGFSARLAKKYLKLINNEETLRSDLKGKIANRDKEGIEEVLKQVQRIEEYHMDKEVAHAKEMLKRIELEREQEEQQRRGKEMAERRREEAKRKREEEERKMREERKREEEKVKYLWKPKSPPQSKRPPQPSQPSQPSLSPDRLSIPSHSNSHPEGKRMHWEVKKTSSSLTSTTSTFSKGPIHPPAPTIPTVPKEPIHPPTSTTSAFSKAPTSLFNGNTSNSLWSSNGTNGNSTPSNGISSLWSQPLPFSTPEPQQYFQQQFHSQFPHMVLPPIYSTAPPNAMPLNDEDAVLERFGYL